MANWHGFTSGARRPPVTGGGNLVKDGVLCRTNKLSIGGFMVVFLRAAQCFAGAEETLAEWNEIGKDRAIEVALIECSEGLSSIPRDRLSEPATGWVTELDSFLDYSGLEIPNGKGAIATKAATLTAQDVGRIAELVKSLQQWFSAENRKGL
ncbi:MAG: hypothetical protein ACTIOG_13905 [Pseudomonas helleri]|uniref:hypothetical protein n=1 Tax=Pseudomonas helleri TaxID=1608996 RepID=UPI003FD69372